MRLNPRSRTQPAFCGRIFLLYHVAALFFLCNGVDAQAGTTSTVWITATIDGQTVSWINNLPTSIPYTPSLLAPSFFDPTTTTTSSVSAISSSSTSLPAGIPSTSQGSSQTSTTASANTIISSSSLATSPSVLASTTSPSSAGAIGESTSGAQPQRKTYYSSHSNAIIVGVVVGVVGLLVLGIVLFWCRRRWRKHRTSPNAPGSAGDREKDGPLTYNRESQVAMLPNVSDTAYSDKESSEGPRSSPTHGVGLMAGAGLSSLHHTQRRPVPQQGNSHDFQPLAMKEAPHVPIILVTGDKFRDHSSQHSHDETEKPTTATSVSSYEGETRNEDTREGSIDLLPNDLTPTMSRPHPLRSNPVPHLKPDFERLHSYQTITNDNPFGERAVRGEIMLNHAAESHSNGYNTSTTASAERADGIEGSLRDDSSEPQYNWLGELRSPSPLFLTESLEAVSHSEAPSGVPGDPEEAMHGMNSPSSVYEAATTGPRTYLAYSQLNETTGLLEERPRFVPGVHQISREEQYRQNRAARRSDPAASDDSADYVTAPATPESPAMPARTWRRSEPPQYLTQQEVSTFDFGGQNLDSAGQKRHSLPPHDLDQDGEFGYLHGQRVRMYEGA